LARTWGNGEGKQCQNSHGVDSEFCRKHSSDEQWRSHGRVDGPIPAAKLKEFRRMRVVHAARKEKMVPKRGRQLAADTGCSPRNADAVSPRTASEERAKGDAKAATDHTVGCTNSATDVASEVTLDAASRGNERRKCLSKRRGGRGCWHTCCCWKDPIACCCARVSTSAVG